MKKLIIVAGFFFIFCMASIAMAGENISGIWQDVDPIAGNSQCIYAQFGNKVQVTAYFEFQGVPWYGVAQAL